MSLAVDVVMGGPSGEAPVSRKSGQAIAEALRRAGCDVACIEIEDSLDLSRLRKDAVIFNIVHGIYGEDGTLQRALSEAGFCFVGSDAVSSALCMDKQATKERLQQHQVPVPQGRRVSLKQPCDPRDLRLGTMTGLVVKPAVGGSSLGLHILANPSFLLPALEQVLQDLGPIDVLIEEQLRGPEYTVALIEGEHGLRALPPICITAESGSYDFEAKYNRDDTSYDIVTETALVEDLQDLARKSFVACACRDLARVDLMQAADGSLRVLEINTLPGFTDHSLVPKAAAAEGMDFTALCLHLVQHAALRMETCHGR